jgi:hypothetical protein
MFAFERTRPGKVITGKGEKGQSFTEFAITFSFMMLLLAGAVDVGRAFWAFIALRDAAQEGAVYASLNVYKADLGNIAEFEDGLNDHVRESSSDPIDLTDTSAVTIGYTLIPGSFCANGLNAIDVQVSYDFQLTMPLIGIIIPSQMLPLTAHVNNTILYNPNPACS